MPSSRTLILFAKAPRPGSVKTRLSPVLGPEARSALAAAFYRDALALVARTDAERKVVAFSPADGEEDLRRLGGEGLELTPQAGGDLGERMRAAFAGAFAHAVAAGAGFPRAECGRVVVIGTDSPTLPPAFLEEAFTVLEAKDVVIGPARDLGYYLIGLARPFPELFEGIAWGTSEVLPETLRRVARAGARLHLLAPWHDVDTPEDLAFLRAEVEALRLAGKPYPAATAALLARPGEPGAKLA
jgi:hypothetical protein